MIKKFHEYIKENKKSILDLTQDEVEDQVLRLKEVFRCEIDIQLNIGNYYYDPLCPMLKRNSENWVYIIIKPEDFDGTNSFVWKNKNEINAEIYQIKNRLEYSFNVKMMIRNPMEKFKDYLVSTPAFIHCSENEIQKFSEIFDLDKNYNFYQILILEK